MAYYNMIVDSYTAERGKQTLTRGTYQDEYLCLSFGGSITFDWIKADTPQEAVEKCKKLHPEGEVECYKKINI